MKRKSFFWPNLLLCLVLSAGILAALPAAPADAAVYSGGNGSVGNPYRIASAGVFTIDVNGLPGSFIVENLAVVTTSVPPAAATLTTPVPAPSSSTAAAALLPPLTPEETEPTDMFSGDRKWWYIGAGILIVLAIAFLMYRYLRHD